MANDRTHLELHHSEWRVRIAVPRAVRPLMGKPHVVVPLGTNSLSEATRLKSPVITAIRQPFDDVRRAAGAAEAAAKANLMREALAWRDFWREAIRDERAEEGKATLGARDVQNEGTQEGRPDRERVASANGVTVPATPLLPLLDRYLSERLSMKPRQKLDNRRRSKNTRASAPPSTTPTVGKRPITCRRSS